MQYMFWESKNSFPVHALLNLSDVLGTLADFRKYLVFLLRDIIYNEISRSGIVRILFLIQKGTGYIAKCIIFPVCW